MGWTAQRVQASHVVLRELRFGHVEDTGEVEGPVLLGSVLERGFAGQGACRQLRLVDIHAMVVFTP